jgi:tRNA-dihydrouridine synthase A
MSTASHNAWRLCVAPMMDWTDRHCRYFHRLLSPNARLYTEMLHAYAVLRGDRARLLDYDPSEHPVALQLGGSDPALLAAAARIGADWGYDEINLNVGCPSERVQSGRFGACLMYEPNLVADCVAAMRAAVNIPVTVKCRIGVDDQDESIHFNHFIEQVASSGCKVFIVHARKAWLKGLSPKENRDIPPLQYARVHQLKRDYADLTIIINGGIDTIESAQQQLAHVDGVMLGRSVYHQPYFLAQLEQALFTPDLLPDRGQLVLRMHDYVQRMRADGERLHHLTRHWMGLYQGQPGARQWRRTLTERSSQDNAHWGDVLQALACVESSRLNQVD